MRISPIKLITCFITFFPLSLVYARVLYVHPDSALNHIYLAFQICIPNDTILVGPGEYNESHLTWPNKQGIHLTSQYGPETTIVHGNINVLHQFDTMTVINGFTMRDGFGSYFGGSIYISEGASPIISNNIITNNTASGVGGGIYSSNASPIIRHNIIRNNSAGQRGGGIGCRYAIAPVIINNTIMNNSTEGTGGGIFCWDECSPLIKDNVLKLNSAELTGSGISCWQASPYISSNTIIRNFASSHGGSIYCWWSSPTIDSCTISSNQSDGVYCEFFSSPIISNNNITDNTGYGVFNTDSTIFVDARCNWWGDTTGPGGFGPGIGDEVNEFVNFIPWLGQPVGAVEEEKNTSIKISDFSTTIITGQLLLDKNMKYRIFDITGRVVRSDNMKPGVYFIEIDGRVTQKVVKVR
jgi:parallel beta-helix repeat protein